MPPSAVSATWGDSPAGMHAAERLGQGTGQAGDERDARRAGEPRRGGAADREAHHNRQRRDQPAGPVAALAPTPTACMMPWSTPSSLDRHEQQHRGGDEDVGQRSRPPRRWRSPARGRAPGSRISSPIVEASSTPTSALHITREAGRHLPADAGHRRCRRPDAARRWPRRRRQHQHDADQRCRAPPMLWIHLPTASAADVGHGDEREPAERAPPRRTSFESASASARASPPAKAKMPGHVDEQHRHVEQVVRPVAPPGQKPVGLAELLRDPEIDAALAGITAAEHQHGDGLGHEERDERQDPQHQREPAVAPRSAARC